MGNTPSSEVPGYFVPVKGNVPLLGAPNQLKSLVDPDSDGRRTLPCRAATHPNELVSSFVDNSVKTAWDIFELGVTLGTSCLTRRLRNPDGTLTSTFVPLSYKEVRDTALRVGNALLSRQIVRTSLFPEEQVEAARKMDLVGVYSKNRVEWFILEQACNAFGLTLCPLYDTLGHESMQYILRQTGLSVCAVAGDSLPALLKVLPKDSDMKLVLFDEMSSEMKTKISEEFPKVTIFSWADLTSFEHPEKLRPPSSETIWTLCYTSGTTGSPKGVLLHHGAIVSCVTGVLRGILSDPAFRITPVDVHISYLPLPHVFERAISNIVYARGATIGVYSGDMQAILDDVKVLKPTVFISVPRLFNRINDKIASSVKHSSPVSRYLFNTGMSVKIHNLRSQGAHGHKVWDKVVFRKITRLMGGQLRFMITGGAPLEAHIQERMKVLFCCCLVEGYGLTESVGTSFIQHPLDCIPGHVGGPLPSLEFCLESVPEMEYSVADEYPRGELLIRGPTLCKGYLLRPEESKEAFKDGWFHTGDICVILPHGGLKIIDRRKNIFKLAQGEYVAPEKIESAYQQCTLLSQVFCFGYPSKFLLVGVAVPDQEEAQRWMSVNKVKAASLEELCANPAFIKAVYAEMAEVEKSAGLKGFEKIKKVHLHPEAFTEANDLLTPTFKLKRHQAKKRFLEDIDRMYRELEATSSSK